MTIHDMPNTDYHAHPAVGSTTLKLLAKHPPAYVKWRSENPEQNAAFDLGTVAHSIILECDASGVAVMDVPDKRTKAWKDFDAETREYGKTPLTIGEWSQVEAMRDAVMDHETAGTLLTGHDPEVSYFGTVHGLDAKCRVDAMHAGEGTALDLKTVQSANPEAFARTAYDLGYHQQAAWYQDVITAATGFTPAFVFILVEKAAPHLVSVVELDAEYVDAGRTTNHRAALIYKRCTETGEWPGYPDPKIVTMPAWARRREQDV